MTCLPRLGTNMNNKEMNQLQVLELKASGKEHLTSEEIQLRNELEFKRNKQNITMRLTGDNKYYNAFQCWHFSQHVLENGYGRYKNSKDNKDIKSITIYNSPYGAGAMSELSTGGTTNLFSFNSQKEALAFIIGFNVCLHDLREVTS